MRRLFLVTALVAVAAYAFAQEVTLSVPITRASATKYKIRNFSVSNPLGAAAASATIDLSSQDASNNEIAVIAANIPGCGSATVAGLGTAMVTVRATETGTDLRKLQFRIIGYPFDQGCLPAGTVAP